MTWSGLIAAFKSGFFGSFKIAKYIIAWFPERICFWLGDLTSNLMNWLDTELACKLLYPVYNNLMHASVLLNDWGDLDQWSKIEPTKDKNQ